MTPYSMLCDFCLQKTLDCLVWTQRWSHTAFGIRLKGGNTINSDGAELSVCHEIRRRRPAGSLVGISLFATGEEESWPLLLYNRNWDFSSSQNWIIVISSDTQGPVRRLTPQQIVGGIFAIRGSWTVLDSKAVQRKKHRTALYPPWTLNH